MEKKPLNTAEPGCGAADADRRFIIAECFCLAYRDRTALLNDYVSTFNLKSVQSVALQRLLELTEDLTKAEAEVYSNGMTTHEAFLLCGNDIESLDASA